MKKIVVFFLSIITGISYGQRHELGVFLGGANAISDIGRTDYINPLPKKVNGSFKVPATFGLIYRRNLNPQQSLRFGLTYASLADSDLLAAENYRNRRGASYTSSILEFSALYEYNFFPINTEQRTAQSPYIFGGLAAFGHPRLKYKYESGKLESKENESQVSMSIPFGVGYKVKFNWNWVLGAEIGFRPTFVNNLDLAWAEESDVEGFDKLGDTEKTSAEELISKRQLGTPKNDWYVFTGFTLTYTFGRPACFCD
uniref:type IX secretion system protein PorG n=1 Tax=Ornithobacterium rhinotracheale TaxID=28251 RepID=UPI0039A692D3